MQKPVETIQASPYTQTPPQMTMDSALTGDELQEIQKMVEGGMVQPMMANPYEQQRTMYKQPQQMNVGGPVVNTPPAPTKGYSASPFISSIGTGFSFERPTQPAPVEVQQTPVTLYGPNGEVVTLMLPKDQVRYNELIAQGYTTTAPTVVTPQPRDDDSDDDDDGEEDNPTWMDKYDYTNFDNLAQQTSAALDGPTTMLGSAAEFVFGGGVLGKLAKASNAAQVAANIVILKAQGQPVSGLETKFNTYIDDNNLRGLKNFITGSQLAKQINTTQVDVGLRKEDTDVFGNKIFKTVEEFNKQMQKNAPEGMVYKPDDDDDDGGAYVRPEGVSAAPDTSIRPPSRPSGSSSDSSSSSGSGSSSLAPSTKPKPKPASGGQDNNPNAPDNDPEDDGGYDFGSAYNYNKGGLMQKKKKK
jgi:hypothetical protein